MSIIAEIVRNMAIDPELLAELSEEQKQIIFCKIREEQVRRWKVAEEELEKQQMKPEEKKNGRKNIDFLLGSDGKEWVWVMGEHKKDKSLEQILKDEAHEKARILAEKEAEELKRKEEEEIKRKMAEEEERLEKELKIKEEEDRKKQEEAAIYQSVKEAKKAFEKMQKERKLREQEEKKQITKIKTVANKELEAVKLRASKRQRGMVDSRSSEYFESILERRKKLEREAEESQKTIDLEWKKQEEKAKAREKEMQEIARHARQSHKQSVKQKLMAVTRMIKLMDNVQENPPLAPKHPLTRFRAGAHVVIQRQRNKQRRSPQVPRRGKVRPAKPTDRNAVRQWFIEDERPHQIGIDKSTDLPFDWFHGIIKRQEAEKLLSDAPVGSFLVRVSERVWGYAISYKAVDRCKHFLIDSSEGKYQFFGIDQIVHNTLTDLVNHHMTNQISELGREYLKYPLGQVDDHPDYYELFSDMLNKDEVTHF
ncbi:SH2 domain-containing protein 4A-like isoform X2 [Lineus longissimus]|uniref:SH2 domain-containing protein 4A-like isoform X2 n=1 Tax=Lineus longissimus TaxID=88925 RepID=UPI00315D45D9